MDIIRFRFQRSHPGFRFQEIIPEHVPVLPRPFLYQEPRAVERILRYVAPVIAEGEDLREHVTFVTDLIRSSEPFLPDHFDIRVDHPVVGRRLKLIVMALNFVLYVRLEKHQDSIDGLRLLFQSIPDPQISWQEMFGYLTHWLTFAPSDRKHSYIDSFRESCAACFPECLRVLKPRSLKHLSRCEVRRCLCRAHTLPHGVWSLPLPGKLQYYVILQARKDQFRPAMRPLSSVRAFKPVPYWAA